MNKLDTWLWHSLLVWLKSTLPKMDDCSFASYTISCVSLALVHDHFHFQWNVFGSLLCIAYFCESSKNEKNTKFNEDILVIMIMMICWITYSCSSLNGIEEKTGRGAKTKAAFISGWYIITFKLTVPCKTNTYKNPITNTKTITISHSRKQHSKPQAAKNVDETHFGDVMNWVWQLHSFRWHYNECITKSQYIDRCHT